MTFALRSLSREDRDAYLETAESRYSPSEIARGRPTHVELVDDGAETVLRQAGEYEENWADLWRPKYENRPPPSSVETPEDVRAVLRGEKDAADLDGDALVEEYEALSDALAEGTGGRGFGETPYSGDFGDMDLLEILRATRGEQSMRVVAHSDFEAAAGSRMVRSVQNKGHLPSNLDGGSGGSGIYGGGLYFAPANRAGLDLSDTYQTAQGWMFSAKLADDSVVVTRDQLKEIKRRMESRSEILADNDFELATLAALLRIDAIEAAGRPELVVINRSKLIVDEYTLPGGGLDVDAKREAMRRAERFVELSEQGDLEEAGRLQDLVRGGDQRIRRQDMMRSVRETDFQWRAATLELEGAP